MGQWQCLLYNLTQKSSRRQQVALSTLLKESTSPSPAVAPSFEWV